MTYSELRERVLDGYMYAVKPYSVSEQTGRRKIMIHTGRGGILQYLQECEKGNIPAELPAECIICETDFGSYPLSVLRVNKIEEDDQIIK